MQEYIINNLAVPILVAVLGGFVVLWLWRANTKKQEKKKLYLPLLNELSASLSNLVTLINRNYPRALSEDTSTQIFEKYKSAAEFINLPPRIRDSLIENQKIKKRYLVSLNELIKNVSTLESKVRRRQNHKRPKDYYVIDFIMLESPPDDDVLLNFPASHGVFHCLFCDKDNAQEIYTEVNEFSELVEYKEMKVKFISSVKNTLRQISREQIV
jgi:hypothetical protein